MELFTLNRAFEPQAVIDEFESVIWTERYYGDSAVELVIPMTAKTLQKFPLGIFISLTGSKEIMILETIDIQDKIMKINGISILSWLNNRFIRTSNKHADTTWYIEPQPAGQILWVMVKEMCTGESPYLTGALPMGIPLVLAEKLIIPELGLHAYDTSGGNISVSIPFGPLYDALHEIATTYQVGMQIIRELPDAPYPLGFRSYRGLNHTSDQTVNPVVRFSPYWDSLDNVKDLQSLSIYKNLIFAYATGADDDLGGPGIAAIVGSEINGFDLRALELFVSDVEINIPDSEVVDLLNVRAQDALFNNYLIQAVDGEIVSTHQFQYGKDYTLGDLVEIQGNSGIVNQAQVTEYIRTQNKAGERAYPTVTVL